MSVYKPRGSSLYIYDFWRGGDRFFGPTGESNKKAAEAVARAEIAKAEEAARKRKESRRRPMSVDVAFGRYWTEIGQHAASAGDIETALAFWLERLGKDKRLDEVTDDDVSQGIGVRRTAVVEAGRTEKGEQLWKPIANATVNRTTQILRRVFQRAQKTWKAHIPDPPDWPEHLLPEPEERIREARFDEQDRLEAAIRDDYRPLMDFAFVSGLRQKASLITWPQVDWENLQIRYQKKRRRAGEGVVWRTIPITKQIAAILRPLVGLHPTHVFTYVARRTRGAKVKGKRYPITVNGLKKQWRRDRARSGVRDFRWHDIRHTAGSRTLRGSRNLRAVQKLLGHEKIESTLRYAHVLDEDVIDALESTEADVARRRESQGMSQGRKRDSG